MMNILTLLLLGAIVALGREPLNALLLSLIKTHTN